MDQLNQIQRIVLRNDLEAKNIQEQSESVREAANNAHDSAIKVRAAYFPVPTIESFRSGELAIAIGKWLNLLKTFDFCLFFRLAPK